MQKKEDNDLGAVSATEADAVSCSVPTPELSHAATLNLNDYVWIRLREPGRAILREQDAAWSRLYASTFGQLAHAEKQEAENDGWSRWQMWSLIQEFGHALYLGCDPPFETTIRLKAPRVGSGTE